MMEHAFHPATTTPKRRTPWNTLSARVITVVSRKGGVGKTTSAVNLGAALALSGHSVLVVGTDPQCGVAPTLGVRPDQLAGGLLDLWDHDANLTDLAHTSPLKTLYFVSPRLQDLDDETRYLRCLQDRPDVFIQQIDRARNLYDTIIIDCPPHLGPPTRAAVIAADGLLVPVQAEELCRDSLGALLGALDTIKEASGTPGLDGPELDGIFLTMYSENTRMGRHVAASVAEEFGPILFETAVPRTTRLSEMALRGKPSVIYDRRSPGSRAYFNLADEILERYRLRNGDVDLRDRQPALARPAVEPTTGPLRARQVDMPTAADRHPAGGLDRLLGDLQKAGALELPSAPQAQDFSGYDLVSLDDLLAEEERDSWEHGWGDAGDRLN
ncbi:MAG: ParA family protein [Candidatus Krumholzibacteriia bacterium]